jgi:hypothetical protein
VCIKPSVVFDCWLSFTLLLLLVHTCCAQKAEKLKESLHFIGMAPQNKHTVFVDSAAEAAAFKASQFFDTPAELLGRTYNRPRNAQLQQQQAPPSAATAERVERCAVWGLHAGCSRSSVVVVTPSAAPLCRIGLGLHRRVCFARF